MIKILNYNTICYMNINETTYKTYGRYAVNCKVFVVKFLFITIYKKYTQL